MDAPGTGTGQRLAEAVALCESSGITAIAGGCPLMFAPTADVGHRCIAWFLRLSGALPRGI